jgi:hypothetical protein
MIPFHRDVIEYSTGRFIESTDLGRRFPNFYVMGLDAAAI